MRSVLSAPLGGATYTDAPVHFCQQEAKPLLIKSGEKKTLDPADVYEINPDFKSKSHKVRLPPGMWFLSPPLVHFLW